MWAAVNVLATSLNAQLVISLNGLLRAWNELKLPWESTNAAHFIASNIAKGYKVFGYEIGNEPNSWHVYGGAVPAGFHAKDFGVLQDMLATVRTLPGRLSALSVP